MKCTCCGKEITDSDRICPNCGENNEGYVEVVVPAQQRTNSYTNQSINRVPINNTPSNQNNGTTVYAYSQTQVVSNVTPEGKGLAVCAIIFSVLGGWLGLLLSIIGLCTYKNPENRSLCKIGLGFCIGWFVLGFILGLAML